VVARCRRPQLAFVEKSKSPRLGDEGEKRHGSLYNYDARVSTVREELQTTHHGRKPSVYEKPEKRDVMVKTNPDGTTRWTW
jgi:hypothetical protein